MQPADGETVFDGFLAESKLKQLTARNDAVLPPCQLPCLRGISLKLYAGHNPDKASTSDSHPPSPGSPRRTR